MLSSVHSTSKTNFEFGVARTTCRNPRSNTHLDRRTDVQRSREFASPFGSNPAIARTQDLTLELILMDDGSNDGSVELVEQRPRLGADGGPRWRTWPQPGSS